ncbi:hypothetical protein DFP73DRAFT_535803 [Morchella snyderi]|nr:hypothetical protein DFP73DRAFT_535803 [Morchella snyderi]
MQSSNPFNPTAPPPPFLLFCFWFLSLVFFWEAGSEKGWFCLAIGNWVRFLGLHLDFVGGSASGGGEYICCWSGVRCFATHVC